MTIRDGHLVGDNQRFPYDGDPEDGLTLQLKATQSSQINTEFVYRGQRKPKHAGRKQVLTTSCWPGESD